MKTKEEIENKIKELYELSNAGKFDIFRCVVVTVALMWVLGEDYLDTNVLIGSGKYDN